MESVKCPLCEFNSSKDFYQTRFNRQFYKCLRCDLSFVAKSSLISPENEKQHYNQHENSELTPGYEKFLYRTIKPILQRSKSKSDKILDYGSGPYPMLKFLLNREGYNNVDTYDYYFAPEFPLETQYKFIIMCEVIEHIYDLNSVLTKIESLLVPGGYFIVSTQLKAHEDLNRWPYQFDISHISLFSMSTLLFLDNFNLSLVDEGKDLFIFEKK